MNFNFGRITKSYKNSTAPVEGNLTQLRKMSGLVWAVRAALILPLALASWASAQSYTLTDLGSLGYPATYGYSVNATGQVAGRGYKDLYDIHAFSYSNGTMKDLGTLGAGTYSVGWGINSTGEIAGFSSMGGLLDYGHAFLYANGTMQDLGTLGGNESGARAINDAGQITGSAQPANTTNYHAFLYSNGVMKDLGTLGGPQSNGYGINSTGQVTGQAYLDNFGYHAFVYSNGTMKDLGFLSGGGQSIGYGINDAGQVVGSSYASDRTMHAFLYTGGAMEDLGKLNGVYSEAWAINNAGEVVGDYFLPTVNDPRGFLYANGSMRDLTSLLANPNSGWIIEQTYGINDVGQITGIGLLNGDYHAFLLTPTPEPGACAIALVAALGLLRRRRNSKDLPWV